MREVGQRTWAVVFGMVMVGCSAAAGASESSPRLPLCADVHVDGGPRFQEAEARAWRGVSPLPSAKAAVRQDLSGVSGFM